MAILSWYPPAVSPPGGSGRQALISAFPGLSPRVFVLPVTLRGFATFPCRVAWKVEAWGSRRLLTHPNTEGVAPESGLAKPEVDSGVG